MVDGDGLWIREIGLQVDGQEVVDFPLALELGRELLSGDPHDLVLPRVARLRVWITFHAIQI
jgi:hypothetical protein